MKKLNRYAYYLLLLLSVLALSGCARYGDKDASEENAKTESQSYETYTAGQLKTQQDFDKFTQDLFLDEVQGSSIDLHFSITDPSKYGITDSKVTLGDFSLEQMQQDMADIRDLKDQLKSFNAKHLTQNQALTYKILMDHVDTELSSEGLELYYQPLGPTIGVQAQLPVLLAEYSFRNQQDVEDYLTLLTQIDTYYAQIMEFENKKAEAGLAPGDNTLDHIIQSCNSYLIRPESNFLTDTFSEKLDALGLSDEQKEEYKNRHLTVLKEHFIPAYQLLVDGLTAMKGKGVTEYGLSYYPKGKEYYEYLVASSTGTTHTVSELKTVVQDQMDNDFGAMYSIMRKDPSVYDELEKQQFSLTDPQAILESLKTQINEAFPPLPECNYTIKYVPQSLEATLSPAFYLVAPLDNYKDNTIYINGSEDYSSDTLYTTLAHEGYPGHLYQHVYFLNTNDCDLRNLLSCGGYTEGWATYVENQAYEFDNGLSSDVAKLKALNSSATTALYALLDISINYEGWTIAQAKDYLNKYYDIADDDVINEIYYAVADNPSNYLEYHVGYLEILNMRKEAEETLKDSFDLQRFHKFILDMGPCSFRVIRPYFKMWMMNYGVSGGSNSPS